MENKETNPYLLPTLSESSGFVVFLGQCAKNNLLNCAYLPLLIVLKTAFHPLVFGKGNKYYKVNMLCENGQLSTS